MGYRIGQARRLLGVHLGRDVLQSDVAAALGVGPATVSRWEADQAVPRDDALGRLAAYLGVRPEYLRYGVGATEAPPGMTHHPTLGDIPLDRLRPVPEPVAKPTRKTAGKRSPK